MAPESRAPHQLSFATVPTRAGLRYISSEVENLSPDEREQYDRNTLFYDVFWGKDSDHNDCIYAVGPAFRSSFRKLIRSGEFYVDGERVYPIEISNSMRASLLKIECESSNGRLLTFEHPSFRVTMLINQSSLADFEHTNALLTLSRNNDLAWIADWAKYHVTTHGVDALLFYDNGSDAYDIDALNDVFAGIPGLAKYHVISAPFLYGPSGRSRPVINSRFLQFALLEIARLRFLGNARSVLQIDVDEMVYAHGDLPLFEQLQQQTSGYLSLNGVWRYAKTDGPARHANHVFRIEGTDTKINPKWVINPTGPMKNQPWRTHGFQGFSDNFVDGYGFYHCRAISTNWDYERTTHPHEKMLNDPVTSADFDMLT